MFERMLSRPWIWLLLLCGVNFFFMLGGHSLWDVDEPNNAVCAREMLAAGNWWVPVFNGGLRYDKPILLYWLMMPLFSLFGVHEWTARLPSAIAMTALVFVVAYFGRRLWDARTGFLAALLLAASLHIAVIARAATPDPLLMLCVGSALLVFLCFYCEDMSDRRLLLTAYAALGLGVLAKGPVAVLLPLLVMGAFLLLAGRIRNWRQMRPFFGLALVLALALPWYVGVGILTHGEWLQGFLLHHNIDRFLQPLQGHRGFPGFYLFSLWLGLFPWSGLLAAAVLFAPWRLAALRRDPRRLFLLCWLGVFLLFFTLARTRLPNYMLPAYPAAALLMAAWMRKDDTTRARPWLLRGALTLSVLATIAAVGALAWNWPQEWFYGLSFLPLVAMAITAVFLRLKANDTVAVLAAGMGFSIFLLAGWSLPALDRHKAAPILAAAADRAGFGGRALATYRYFQPSLLYYHGGRLPLLPDARAASAWLLAGKALVMPQEALSDFPPRLRARFKVFKRIHGLYARKWLVLVTTTPVRGKT